MKNYIIYDKEGNILRTGFCADHLFAKQKQADEFIMEGTALDTEHKIDVKSKKHTIIKFKKKKEQVNVPSEYVTLTKSEYQDILKRLDALEAKDK